MNRGKYRHVAKHLQTDFILLLIPFTPYGKGKLFQLEKDTLHFSL